MLKALYLVWFVAVAVWAFGVIQYFRGVYPGPPFFSTVAMGVTIVAMGAIWFINRTGSAEDDEA